MNESNIWEAIAKETFTRALKLYDGDDPVGGSFVVKAEAINPTTGEITLRMTLDQTKKWAKANQEVLPMIKSIRDAEFWTKLGLML